MSELMMQPGLETLQTGDMSQAKTRPLSYQGSQIDAVLFDVDGTLYRQKPLRVRMALELAGLPLRRSPGSTLRTVRVLSAFRRLREELRDSEESRATNNVGRRRALESLQYEVTASHTGEPVRFVREVVAEWIFQRPLRHLRGRARAGLLALLETLRSRGVRVGVFSDYPVWDKLRALGVAHFVDVAVCATEPDVDAFKPEPRGFLVASQRWGLTPERVLYVGDRAEVDAEGAARAGMPCAIIGDSTSSTRHSSYSTYEELRADLHDVP